MARKPDPLATYKAKRDFARSAEPEGKPARSDGEERHFVVQKHAARRLHWDFRLEIDGVLVSWAVTRGPSADPDDKRLAVRTEDHPLAYGDFEGTIPEGEYGGGSVMLWDEGTWEPVPGKSADDLAEGHLHFVLHGKRMQGEWLLVRMKRRKGEKRENWLLRKIADDKAATGDVLVDEDITSVRTGRTMAEIAEGTQLPRKRRPKAKLPTFRPVQLATLVDTVPTGNGWIHEIKFDGYRALIAASGEDVRVFTRSGHDWSDKFAPLIAEVASLDLPPCLIDGEIIARDAEGNPDFSALQAVLKRGHGTQTRQDALEFHAFDLLAEDDEDLTGEPQITRKERLASLLEDARPPLFVADHVIGAGEKLFRAMCEAGQEGVVSKRIDAPYHGTRTRNWVKVKCILRQEFVIVGFTPSKARARPFASLLLAQHDDENLIYRGRVGTGFDDALLDDIARRLSDLEVAERPLEVPDADRRHVRWVRPELVAEVAYAELSAEGRLRHASFIGLRTDKPPQEVHLEMPAPSPAQETGIRITHPDRVIFPESGDTKQDLADYIATIAPLMLPFVAGRPLSLVRCPGGRDKACFFQKHDGGSFGPDVRRVSIAEKDGGHEDYLYVNDVSGLLTCIQMGTIEFHAWQCMADNVERPDRLIIDLDPDEGIDFRHCANAAITIRNELAEIGLQSFALLSGGKGVHITVPLQTGHDWQTHADFARRFAVALAATQPDLFVATMSKAKRKGRIFIDWLRNQRGATAIVPYSARARAGAPVAVPVSWDELHDMDTAHPFSIRDGNRLVERAKALQQWGKARQSLPGI